MDQSVIDAIAKWPQVPDVYGWLSLDRRGVWRIKGSPVTNAGLVAFIGRNYACDAAGNWYFQNGPQRVFVMLDGAPWILRLATGDQLETHTGLAIADLRHAWLDDQGRLLIATEHGLGLVSDRDLPPLLERVCGMDGAPADEAQLLGLMAGTASPLQLRIGGNALPVSPLRSDRISRVGKFVAEPIPPPDSDACL